jgi:hypothetical protein
MFKKHSKLNQNSGDEQKSQFDKKLIKKLKKNTNLFKLEDDQSNTIDNSSISSDFESIFVKLNEIN